MLINIQKMNVYAGEQIDIPREACRRHQQTSTIPIVRARVGIWHGGEYILNPEVPPERLSGVPAWLSQKFEGFRIGYVEHDPNVRFDDDE